MNFSLLSCSELVEIIPLVTGCMTLAEMKNLLKYAMDFVSEKNKENIRKAFILAIKNKPLSEKKTLQQKRKLFKKYPALFAPYPSVNLK